MYGQNKRKVKENRKIILKYFTFLSIRPYQIKNKSFIYKEGKRFYEEHWRTT